MSLRNRKLLALIAILASASGGSYFFLIAIKSGWFAHFKNPGWERWQFWANLCSVGVLLCVGLFFGATWYLVKTRSMSKYASGYCQECGYDLMGNASGRCPECGKSIEV